MALELNIDKDKVPIPTKEQLKSDYATHLIAAAVIAVVLFLSTDFRTWGGLINLLTNFTLPFVLLLGTMLICYMVFVTCSSDSLMQMLNASGLLGKINLNLTYAVLLNLIAFFLNIIIIRWLTSLNVWGTAPAWLSQIVVLVMLFIIGLAFVFVFTTIIALMDVGKARIGAE